MRLLLLCSACLVAAASTSIADWVCIGPQGGQINHLVQNESNGTLYGTSGSYPVEVVKSTDGGQTWSSAGSFNGYEYSMACGPTGTIFCGGSSYVYWSTNGGSTWTTSPYQQNTLFYGMATHPTDPQTIYSTGYRYSGSVWQMFFGKSTNGGSTWTYTILATDQSYGQGIAVSRTNPQLVFCTGYVYTGSTYLPKLYRSTDGGATFSEVQPAGASTEYYGYSVAVHPTNASIVLWGSLYGIWRSTDGGTNWTDCSSTTYNYGINFSLADPNTAWAGAYNGVLKSTNGGQSWTLITSGLSGSYFYNVVGSATDVTRVNTGSTYGSYRSTNTGTSWTQSNEGLYLGRDMAIAVAPSQPSMLLKQMQAFGVWRSTNYGTSWTQVTMPLSCGDFCSIVFNPTNPQIIMALEGGG